jgi:FkbM family methyltransferase
MMPFAKEQSQQAGWSRLRQAFIVACFLVAAAALASHFVAAEARAVNLARDLRRAQDALKSAEQSLTRAEASLTSAKSTANWSISTTALGAAEQEVAEPIPPLKRLPFACSAPGHLQLQSGCRLSGARGKYAGKLNEKGRMKDGLSQAGEDRYLYENFFFDKRNGVYLEMGALDGLQYSNSAFFSRKLGWSGLLIEGSPKKFDALKANRGERDICVNAMICSSEKPLHYIESDDVKNAVGGAWELMTPHFKALKHGDMTEEKVSKLSTVPCVSMADILSNFGIRHVDIFSLDVEGAEAQVLETIDWQVSPTSFPSRVARRFLMPSWRD